MRRFSPATASLVGRVAYSMAGCVTARSSGRSVSCASAAVPASVHRAGTIKRVRRERTRVWYLYLLPDSNSPAAIVFDGVSFAFDGHVVLRDVSFTVPTGSMRMLLG